MKETIYALLDPRKPRTVMYVGRSSQWEKRLRNHINQTRWREKHGKKMPDVMEWISQLLHEGVEPIIRRLAEAPNRDAAILLEQEIIARYPRLLNSPKANLGGGKLPGTKDSVSGINAKKKAWRDNHDERVETFKSYPIHRNAKKANVTKRRMSGYPHPEHAIYHPLNDAHRIYLREKNGVNTFASERQHDRHLRRRQALGYPNPHEGVHHPDNLEWVAEQHAKGIRLTRDTSLTPKKRRRK